MSQLFIGVDPGEEHVGFAILNVKSQHGHRRWTLNMGVRDVSHHGFYTIIDQIGEFPQISNMSIKLIIESYQQRPVGHQQFNTALTPQFIGALRYIAHVQDTEDYLIQPGPIDDLDRLFFTPIIERWNPIQRTHKHWKHALSALRVIGIYLMSTEPDWVASLRNATDIKEIEYDEVVPLETPNDCATFPVQWRTPK